MTTASQSLRYGTSLVRDTAMSAARFCAQWLSVVYGSDSNAAERELGRLRPVTMWCLVGLTVLLVSMTGVVFAGAFSVYQARSTVLFEAKGNLPAMSPTHSKGMILERPVFRRSRAPIASSDLRPSSALSNEAVAQFSLKGVFLNGATAKAFLSTSADPVGTWYQLNEEVGGWRLVEVQPASIALDLRGQRQTVPLRIDGPLR